MPHLTIKIPLKIKDLPFSWQVWQVLAGVLARKNCLKSMRCHSWHKLSGENDMAWIQARKEAKKRVKKSVTEM